MVARSRTAVVFTVLTMIILGVASGGAPEDLSAELEAIAQQYSSGEWRACMEAGNALSDLGEVGLPLAPLLADLYVREPDADCGQDAARGLLNIGPGIREVVPPASIVPQLVAQVEGVGDVERTEAVSDAETAITLLGYYGDQARSAIPVLVALLMDPSTPFDRATVASALGRVGSTSESAAEALLAIAADGSIDQYGEMGLRAAAARGLGLNSAFAARSAPALVGVLDDADGSLAYAAGEALTSLGAGAAPALAGALADESFETFSSVLRLLRDLGPDGAAALPALVHALSVHDGTSFWELGEALMAVGPGDGSAVPDLVELIEQDDSEVATTAIRVLGWWGPAAAAALPTLEKAASEGPWMVRSDAEEAIDRIRGG